MGVYIKENQECAYIYLCGIKPFREVALGDGITLLPAFPNPEPDDMIDSIMKSNHASELELGLLISTLRMTWAQIRIEGAIGKDLAIKTWNAQEICIQMGAIIDCDLAWYFQADRPVELFSRDTDIHMMVCNIHKIPSNCIELSEEKCSFLQERIQAACKLAEVNRKYYLATNAMWSYRMNFMPAIRIGVIWSGIEALFMVEHNIKNTIAVVSSRFICGNDDMVEEIRNIYREARCKAIHEYQNGTVELYEKSKKLLHELILKCIDEGNTPDTKRILTENKTRK